MHWYFLADIEKLLHLTNNFKTEIYNKKFASCQCWIWNLCARFAHNTRTFMNKFTLKHWPSIFFQFWHDIHQLEKKKKKKNRFLRLQNLNWLFERTNERARQGKKYALVFFFFTIVGRPGKWTEMQFWSCKAQMATFLCWPVVVCCVTLCNFVAFQSTNTIHFKKQSIIICCQANLLSIMHYAALDGGGSHKCLRSFTWKHTHAQNKTKRNEINRKKNL